MPKVEIVGIPPWDGVYELDNEFTNREYRMIKDISDVRAGEIEEEARRGNMDLLVAFAVVALAQHDKVVLVDDLWNAKAGKIIIHADPVTAKGKEETEDPQAAAPLEPPNDEDATSSDPSGSGSSEPSESPASDQPPTGEPG